MSAALDVLAGRLGGLVPRYGIVLGSGLGSLVGEMTDAQCIQYHDLPGFPVSAVSGHAGEVVAGSLREDMPPGSVMQITDHINYSGMNPLIGEESDRRFVGMTSAYDAGLADSMRKAAEKLGIALSQGVYMWFSGPSFETPAEIRMARILGADAVGMSTVPEVIIARMLGLRLPQRPLSPTMEPV